MNDNPYSSHMTPILESMEERIKAIHDLDEYQRLNFSEQWAEMRTKNFRLIESCKGYIYENHEKVKDWSHLLITMYERKDGKDTVTHRFSKKREEKPGKGYDSPVMKRLRAKMNYKEVETLSRVYYDFMDGDFSVTINGIDFVWIGETEILTIACYIEERLKAESVGYVPMSLPIKINEIKGNRVLGD